MDDALNQGAGNPGEGEAAKVEPAKTEGPGSQGSGVDAADKSAGSAASDVNASKPTTIEEANAIIAARDKELTELRDSVSDAAQKKRYGELKAARRVKAARDGAAAGLFTEEDGESKPVKITDSDGKVEEKKLAEVQVRATLEANRNLAIMEAQEEAKEYIRDYGKHYGMDQKAADEIYPLMEKFAKGETSMEQDYNIIEAYIRGQQVTKVIDKAVALAEARKDAEWEAKIIAASVPGASALAITGERTDLSKIADPLTRSVHEILSGKR